MAETVYGFVPARKGSQGILNKNLKRLGGLSLVARAIKTLRETPGIDRVILSTDCPKIAKEGKAGGAEAPFLRPAGMATATSPVLSAIHHTLGHFAQEGVAIDRLVMVQPTSPFITPDTVAAALKHAQDNGLPLVQTVSPVKDHPYWVRVPDGLQMFPYQATFGSLRRQDLPDVFVLNGAVNIYHAPTVLDNKLPSFPGYFLIDRIEGLDIDDETDWFMAEAIFQARARQEEEQASS